MTKRSREYFKFKRDRKTVIRVTFWGKTYWVTKAVLDQWQKKRKIIIA